MLGEPAKVPAEIFDVELPAVRGTTDVDDVGVRIEPHGPSCVAKASLPIGLLAEHEEGFVEQSCLSRGGAPHKQRRTRHPVDAARLVVLEATDIHRVEHARVWRKLAEKEVLGCKAPECWVGPNALLEGAVGVEQSRPNDRSIGVGVCERDEFGKRPWREPRIGVDEKPVAPLQRPHARVVSGTHAEVALFNKRDVGIAVAHELNRAVGRSMVDDDGRCVAKRVEALRQPREAVECDDDGRDVGKLRHRVLARAERPPRAARSIRAARGRV